jgi:hypothetical protein
MTTRPSFQRLDPDALMKIMLAGRPKIMIESTHVRTNTGPARADGMFREGAQRIALVAKNCGILGGRGRSVPHLVRALVLFRPQEVPAFRERSDSLSGHRTACDAKGDCAHIGELLSFNLQLQLSLEGVGFENSCRLTDHYTEPEITKSRNRSVIGTAVDYEQGIIVHLNNPYAPAARDQVELSVLMARTPILSMKGEHFPCKAFSNELLKRYGEAGHFGFEIVGM